MADISQFSMSFGIQRAVTILRILLLFSSILLLKGIVNRSYKLDVISTKDINLHNKKNSTHFFKRIFIKAWAFSSKEMCVILEDILEGHACVINPIFADVKAEYGQCINTIRTYSYKPKFIHQRNLTKQPTYSIIKLTIEIYNTEECIKMIQNIDKNKFMCVDLTGRRKIHLSKVKFVIVLRNGLLDFHRVFGSCIGFYRQNSCYGRMFMGSHSSSPQRRYTQSSVKNSSNTCRSFARLCISDSVFRNNSCLNYLCANASEIIWQKITFRSFEICNIVQVKQSYNENVSDPIINYKLVLTESGVIDKPRCDLQFTRGIKTMGGGGKMIVIDCNATRLARENTSQPSTNGEFSLLPRIKLKRQNRSSPVKISSLDMNNFNTKSAKEITMPTVTARSVAKMHDGLDLQMSESFSQHSFNVTVSDSLPLNRMIPDLAPKSCPRNFDLEGLPDASVVICFHNEAISALLRTVWSVLSRSPPSILKEIILVDDASTLESLGKPLAAAFANWTKVKLTRTFKREGLIRARLIGIRRFHAHGNKFKEQYFGQVDLIISAPNVIGANRASGDVLVFLDSHCECNQDWLQPLLHRIKNNKTTIACPEIDVIDPYTFQYIQTPENLHGYFTWNLDFAWKGIPFSKKHPEDPVSTPVMVGGIFAVEREYFFHMGSYDEQMEIWGGENLEISFRIWMCGGTIEILPCSRVGHVYRLRIPYLFPDGVRATVQRNKARVAGVWMDEFKMFYFASNGVSDPGDLWRRHSLRKNLRCHGFRWYLDNVIPELPVPSKDTLYFGEVRNELKLLCLEAGPNKGTKRRVTLEGCHGNMKYQYFSITTFGQMKLEDSCLEFETSDEGDLVLADCSGSEHQKWKIKGHSIINIVTRKCITAVKSIVRLQDCAHGENCKSQHWTFSYYFTNK